MNNIYRKISLVCPLCGNTMFSSNEEDLSNDADDIIYRCVECKSEYSREEILEANSELIENTKDEIINVVLADLKKRFRKVMKK